MALNTAVLGDKSNIRPSPTSELITYPSSFSSDWVTLCDAPETADNSGSAIVNPSGISRAAQRLFQPCGKGTTLLVRMAYDDGITLTTSPIIQAFGRDHNGLWHKLSDSSGTHALTLTVATTTDVTDGTDNYTDNVEIDMDCSEAVLVAVKVAFAVSGGSAATSRIQVKVK